jgi:hypothetical protein
MSFARFIAVDWSGAKALASYRTKLQVAEASTGTAAPVLVTPARGWGRRDVLAWLNNRLADGVPTLVGFDFSFAPPFVDQHSYLPGEVVPTTGPAFWAFVDACCEDDDFGAASFLEARFRRHFYLGKSDGPKAPYMRLRLCEQRFNASGGGKPSSVFDAIGAAQVAKASFAGMRLLHHLGEQVPVWPFCDRPVAGSVVVEIYCRAFIRHAGLRGLKLRTAEQLNAALAGLASDPWTGDAPLTDDQTDALVAAAGLRAIAEQPAYWQPEGLSALVARTEGWTFGVV